MYDYSMGSTCTHSNTNIENGNKVGQEIQMSPINKLESKDNVETTTTINQVKKMFKNGPKRRPSTTSMAESLTSFYGFFEMITITEFEKVLVKNAWTKAINKNPYMCEYAYDRIFTEMPQLRILFKMSPEPSKQTEKDDHRKLREQADRVRIFMSNLVDELQNDTNKTIEMCEELGRRHATRYANDRKQRQLLSVESWKTFCEAFLEEFKVSLETDNVEQREMEMITWRHFITAVTQIVCAAFEENILHTEQLHLSDCD